MKSARYATLFLLILIQTTPALTDETSEPLPLWELGVMIGAARIPHYRGSDQDRGYILPLPYIIYRGKFLQADKDSIRGILFKTNCIESDISIFGNPPVPDDNTARQGMPDLDALVEAGPALKLFLLSEQHPDSLCLMTAVRGVASVDIEDGVDVAYQGIHAGANLIYKNSALFDHIGIQFSINAGIDFVDKNFSSYFYDVSEEYALSDRPAYESDSGYGGFSLSIGIQKKISDTLSFGTYCRWDNIDGAVFEHSPLVKNKDTITFGCAIIWTVLKANQN